MLRRVGSASSSRLKVVAYTLSPTVAYKPPVVVKLKSCGPFGTVSLMMVMVPVGVGVGGMMLLVKVTVADPPAASSMVAVLAYKSDETVAYKSDEIVPMLARVYPAAAASVTV